MSTLLNYLAQLIMSFFLGVNYVEQTQDKIFTKDNYYQREIGEVNYIAIYKNYEGSLGSDEAEQCNTGKYALDPNFTGKKIQDSNSNGYLFYTTTDTSSRVNDLLANATKDSDLSAYVIRVPAGTKIIAPYNCTLDINSLSASENMYPTDSKGKSMGSYIRVITDETENGQFRITIGSIARHWCCLHKSHPKGLLKEGDETTPYYEHTYTPSQTYKFSAGDVIAEAGQTGVTDSVRKETKDAFIYIKVEKRLIGTGFVPVDIQELYKTKV